MFAQVDSNGVSRIRSLVVQEVVEGSEVCPSGFAVCSDV